MLHSVMAALMFTVVPLSAAAAQTVPPAPAQKPATAPQDSATGGMTGHDHAGMQDGHACDCLCMKQEKGSEAATKKPPLHDHAKEHKQQ